MISTHQMSLGFCTHNSFPRQCPLFQQHFSLGITDPAVASRESWISKSHLNLQSWQKEKCNTGFKTLNLHVSTHKTVISSEWWVIEAPVQQVVITCIEVPRKNKIQFKDYISSLVLTQWKGWLLNVFQIQNRRWQLLYLLIFTTH